MKTRFKFLRHSVDWGDAELCGFNKCSNPTFVDNLPDGEYMIRGHKKGSRIDYWKVNGQWYLSDIIEKDNGHYMCDAGTYRLYPELSEKEWEMLNNPKVYSKLTPYWKRMVYGRKHWMDLRDQSREMAMSWIRFEKEMKYSKVGKSGSK